MAPRNVISNPHIMICFLIFFLHFNFTCQLLFYYHYYFFPFFLFFYHTSCILFPTNKPLHPQCRRLIILEYEGELYTIEVISHLFECPNQRSLLPTTFSTSLQLPLASPDIPVSPSSSMSTLLLQPLFLIFQYLSTTQLPSPFNLSRNPCPSNLPIILLPPSSKSYQLDNATRILYMELFMLTLQNCTFKLLPNDSTY